ncbi:flagellar hook capping protein [Novosphingobium fuchskuhlense]|uniref:Basal-body rod modification protein FlgD n=1 Tax=Novosphingobium fuchskuhlense TaxID=1117702 RepID=A0A117US80_9SPHN|nr:flagellar hook capping FlgD N-terminal domain-containing protein [Novosphingobium fuchskuhlense]KUR69896.1 flagellar hook capping protein [Novosphingobium fuchskuhlense]
MALAPVTSSGQSSSTGAASPTTQSTATNAFGLSFESLLKIILTQLTYQDPLKPVDNFEFVSQLAQFSQIQQGQTMNDRLQSLVSAQSTLQASGLLGKTIDIPSGNAVISGTVTAVTLQNGDPLLTIKTKDGQTIGQLSLSSISQIRLGE